MWWKRHVFWMWIPLGIVHVWSCLYFVMSFDHRFSGFSAFVWICVVLQKLGGRLLYGFVWHFLCISVSFPWLLHIGAQNAAPAPVADHVTIWMILYIYIYLFIIYLLFIYLFIHYCHVSWSWKGMYNDIQCWRHASERNATRGRLVRGVRGGY